MIELRRTARYIAWSRSLRDQTVVAKIAQRLTRLQGGHFGDVKPVGAGVSELRVNYGPGFRIYFVRRGAELIVLLGGGDKSTQKADIAKAKELASFV